MKCFEMHVFSQMSLLKDAVDVEGEKAYMGESHELKTVIFPRMELKIRFCISVCCFSLFVFK